MLDVPGLNWPRLTRELVALCERPEPRLGPEPGLTYLTPEEHGVIAERLLAETGPDEFWVFAYGSLLWRPASEVAQSMRATAEGWRRDFCKEIPRWRGTPEQPGLMMALRRGGSCDGMALQLGGNDRKAQLVKILRREIDIEEDLQSLRFIKVDTEQGMVRALACWAEPVNSRFFAEKELDQQARMLARACGSTGSGAAYLFETISKLAEFGITDSYLRQLEIRVAEEILALRAAAAP